MSDSPSKALLQHNKNIINGIMSIEIVNLDDIYEDEADNQLSIWYKSEYQNNEWKSKSFTIKSVNNDKTFFLKVPLYLLSYSLQYKLGYKIIKNNNNNLCMDSITYTVEIPSILIDTAFKKGDTVRFSDAEDEHYYHSGIIAEIMDDNMIKINYVNDDDDEFLDNVIIIHASKVGFASIDYEFVIDITNTAQAMTDMILKTNNKTKMDIYCVISNVLNDNYYTNKAMRVSEFIATDIYEFLYAADYNYRIQCILGDSFLLQQKAWNDFLQRGSEINDPEYTRNPQMFWESDTTTYSCDICRIEMIGYDYIFGCKCDTKSDFDDGHAFCVSCIHSIMIQYNELKPFISELLRKVINDNCIEEIVTFCVGKVIKYNDYHHDDGNKMDINIVIDDNKPVGSKRAVITNTTDSSRKKRRLQ